MTNASPEMHAFYDQAGALEATDLQVAQVVQRVLQTRRRPRPAKRRFAVLLAVGVAAVSTAFAYPAARDALDSFFDGGATPGTPSDSGSLPEWLTGATNLPVAQAAPGSQRLVAEQDGQRLLAYRDARSGRACLVFGSDSDTCSDSNDWHRLFGDHALLKLASGVGPTADGQVAVFGLARSSVVTVELRDGDTIVNSTPVTNGGWVIVAPQGDHRSLVGLDRNGKPIETLDARDWTWKFCFEESGCP
jgi:hypothetical protein